MARFKLVALSNAVEDRDEEFNHWYDKQHLPDVMSVPGFVSAERLTCLGEGQHRYMAIYEIETDDIGSVLAEFGKRPGTDLMPLSDALDLSTAQIGFWQPMVK
ncbi:hypothetical protein GVN24_23065 [Rhizobium sp. CRIBSB]|nr:hypothetical protein [Rhizobium sp. CRIBSB]